MSDEDLGQLLRGIFNWVKAGFVIGAFTLAILVMTHWDKSLLAHGWKAKPESSEKTSAEDPAPLRSLVRHRARRVSVSSPEPVIDDQPEHAAPVPVVPPPVVVVVVAAPEERHFIAHHKGRGGCDGDLVLTAASLRFDCPSRPGELLTFSRAAVRADDDGIRDLTTGHPYHFKISAMNKPQVRALFNAWVAQR
jgi:hypothetical protein